MFDDFTFLTIRFLPLLLRMRTRIHMGKMVRGAILLMTFLCGIFNQNKDLLNIQK